MAILCADIVLSPAGTLQLHEQTAICVVSAWSSAARCAWCAAAAAGVVWLAGESLVSDYCHCLEMVMIIIIDQRKKVVANHRCHTSHFSSPFQQQGPPKPFTTSSCIHIKRRHQQPWPQLAKHSWRTVHDARFCWAASSVSSSSVLPAQQHPASPTSMQAVAGGS